MSEETTTRAPEPCEKCGRRRDERRRAGMVRTARAVHEFGMPGSKTPPEEILELATRLADDVVNLFEDEEASPDHRCRNCATDEDVRKSSEVLCHDCFDALACLDCKSNATEPDDETFHFEELCSEDLANLPIAWRPGELEEWTPDPEPWAYAPGEDHLP